MAEAKRTESILVSSVPLRITTLQPTFAKEMTFNLSLVVIVGFLLLIHPDYVSAQSSATTNIPPCYFSQLVPSVHHSSR